MTTGIYSRMAGTWILALTAVGLFAGLSTAQTSQTSPYPKKIRGYKVERTIVEVKKSSRETKDKQSEGDTTRRVRDNRQGTDGTSSVGDSTSDASVDALIKFGDPQLAGVTPLGITLEIPIVVAPVRQKGRVDFLVFEDMVVNDTPVEIAEYHRAFDLPNRDPLTLREPLSFYIYLPRAALAAIDEWVNSKETWPVTGRIYVFGKFTKSLFSFKRCVPVQLNLTMRNPLRKR